MSASWPESLKTWVTSCLTQMTEANKADAAAELKLVIKMAFDDGTMWTKDWSKARLKALEPKSFKRKTIDSAPTQVTKKAKKSALASSIAVAENDERLLQRARRFQREHQIERQKQAGLHPEHEYSRHVNHALSNGLEDRMEGLTTSYSFVPRGVKGQSRRKYLNSSAGYSEDPNQDPSNALNWDRFTIVGTSKEIYKNYLRLTSEPDPRDIRPYPILSETFQQLKTKWKTERDGQQAKIYPWICDQFKSLRQDLTVQRIKTEFTVQVYEVHARMALEVNDLVEYNQCQSALRTLYEMGLSGKSEEFLAYRILYLLHVRNRSDLNRLISSLTPQVKAHSAVRHALEVQRAMATSNYHTLFRLYNVAPNMGGYLMDYFVPRERLGALCLMTKAYLTLPLSFIEQELAFGEALSAHDFLTANDAAIYVAASGKANGAATAVKGSGGGGGKARTVDCKAVHLILVQKYEEKSRRVAIQGAI